VENYLSCQAFSGPPLTSDQLKEAASAASTSTTPLPPKPPINASLDPALDHLSLMLGSGEWSLHPSISIERRMFEDGDRAVALTYAGLRMTIREAWDLNLLAADGRFDHLKAQAISHAVLGRDPRTIPARRLRF
jgi:hypothetical protein